MREGGEPEEDLGRLAPVTPLFGARSRASSSPAAPAESAQRSSPAAEAIVPKRTGEAGLWRSALADEEAPSTASPAASSTRDDVVHGHPARGGVEREKPRLRALRPHDGGGVFRSGAALDGGAGSEGSGPEDEIDPERAREAAQEILVRKLRSKALSVSEARQVLRGQEIDSSQIEEIIDEFSARGYLDDATLAWHLVTSGVERKGQGRVALMRALAQRGIPRDVIDDALRELPDDDAERALEFARSKARSFSGLDQDVALRRLVGQLSRRGYNGSVAMTAARTALTEASFGAPRSGVRFVDSD